MRHATAFRLTALIQSACLAALLAACAGPLPDKPQRPDSYDLGLPAAAASAAPQTPAQAPLPPLALPPATAPAALDGTAMLYRLAYQGEQASQLRPYAQARWSMSAPELLTQRLRETLAASRPVVAAGEGLAALELRVHLDDFSQIFEAENRSRARIQIRATLIAPHASQRLLGQRTFIVQRPAPTPDAAGGAQAMREAADAAIADMAAWLASPSLAIPAAPGHPRKP